jgi:hypothetical protein
MLSLFRPAQLAPSVPAIDLEALWGRGVRGIVLDADNTLCAWGWAHATVEEPVRAWVAQAKALGFRLCIISNGRPGRVGEVAAAIGLPCVARARKPFRRGFLQALTLLGTAPETTAAVGDQLLTDVLGGNRAGFHSILVPALSTREFAGTKLNRLVEGFLRRRLGLPGLGG